MGGREGGVVRFWMDGWLAGWMDEGERVYVVVYRSEDFFGGDEEGCHFPYCHFEIHLREFE